MSITTLSSEIFCGIFRPEKLVAQTARTQVWEVANGENRKFEAKLVLRNYDARGRKPFLAEFKVYAALTNGQLKYGQYSNGTTPPGFLNICYAGRHENYDLIVTQRLPQDVFSLRNENPWADNFSTSCYQSLACGMLEALISLHEQGFVHRNVKPQNFKMHGGLPHLVDFSDSKRYIREKTKTHYKPRKEAWFTGTLKYASLNAHCLQVLSRRDDLISLGYSVIDMIKKSLPWDCNFTSQQTFEYQDHYIKHMKEYIPLDYLCQGLPEGIHHYMRVVSAMSFHDSPNYNTLEIMLALRT